VLTATRDQMDRLHITTHNDARPVQALHERVVTRYSVQHNPLLDHKPHSLSTQALVFLCIGLVCCLMLFACCGLYIRQRRNVTTDEQLMQVCMDIFC
jgi:hypothetical protein